MPKTRTLSEYSYKSAIYFVGGITGQEKEAILLLNRADLTNEGIRIIFSLWPEVSDFESGATEDKRLRKVFNLPNNNKFIQDNADLIGRLRTTFPAEFLSVNKQYKLEFLKVFFFQKEIGCRAEHKTRLQFTQRATESQAEFDSIWTGSPDLASLETLIWTFGQANNNFLKRFK